MRVKIKTGEIILVDEISKEGILTGTDETGKIFNVDKAEILDIIKNTITIWDILRGLFAKLRILFRK